MRTNIARKCLEIIRKIVATQNIGGISYVEEGIEQEIKKNELQNHVESRK